MNIHSQIQSLLQGPDFQEKLKFWNYSESVTQRKEFYLVKGEAGVEANQSRLVEINDCFLTVWIAVDGDSAGPAKLGSAHGRINPAEDLKSQIELLLEKAALGAQNEWKPEGPETGVLKPKAQTCAHQFLENFSHASDSLMKELAQAVEAQKGEIFNSAELFCSLEKTKTLNSLGASLEFPQSKIYAEVCFSASDEKESQELMEVAWSARPEDLDFKAMCLKSVAGAKGLLKATTTPAGVYQAKLHAQDLGFILSNLTAHFSGDHKYSKLPFFEKGSDLIPSFAGQSFDLKLNPRRDFGIDSLGYDSWGMEENEVLLSSGNKVMNGYYSQKMAQYLEVKPNTSGGVLEVWPTENGSVKLSESKDRDILEIVQFSGLFVEGMSMTFSSEIRLGILHKADGTRTFVKGGNFSGSFKENFARVQWNSEMRLIGVEGEHSVFVPSFAVLNDVSVS